MGATAHLPSAQSFMCETMASAATAASGALASGVQSPTTSSAHLPPRVALERSMASSPQIDTLEMLSTCEQATGPWACHSETSAGQEGRGGDGTRPNGWLGPVAAR